jgi:hypothetical protein
MTTPMTPTSPPTEPRRPRPALLGALAAAALLLGARPAGAQVARVSLEVDHSIAAVGEAVQVTVQIEVEGQAGYESYLPPTFSGLRVEGSGMTSQNIEMINWKVRRTESHSYQVVPLAEGNIKIGPAAITLGGRVVRSRSVTLQVKKGKDVPPPPSPVEPSPPQEPAPSERSLAQVFLSAQATPRKVFVGQQVLALWHLYTQSDILGFNPTRQPTTDGFWSEDLESPRRLEFERRVVSGRVFYEAVLARKALFPQRVGKLTLGPMEARVRTFDTFGNAPPLQSEAVEIEVVPLPTEGRPPGFNEHSVGQFTIASSLDHARISGGDAVSLKVVVRGNGDLRQLKLPPLEARGLKVYEPKVTDRLTLERGVSGEKIFEYLLLPTAGGRLVVPALHLDYFDPEAKAYKRTSTSPLALEVLGRIPTTAGTKGDDGEKNVLGPSIRPPRPARPLESRSRRDLHRQPVVLGLLLGPVLLLLGLSGGERLKAALAKETPRSLQRAAERLSQGHLRRAQTLRRQGDKAGFFGEVALALTALCDHKLGARCEGLTRGELSERMLAAGFPEALVSRVTEELDNCDFARFAPSASEAAQLEKALGRAKRLLAELGRVRARGERS